MNQHTSPKRKRGRVTPPYLVRATCGVCLLLAPLVAGCNDAGRGVEARPAVTVIPASEDDLCARIDAVRDANARRYMNTRDHAAWQLVHGILAYQDQLLVDHSSINRATGSEQTERVQAVKLLLERGDEVRGFTLRPERDAQNNNNLVPGGLLATEVEGGSKSGQGHPNQWLGYLLVDYVDDPPPGSRQPPVNKDTRVIYRGPSGEKATYTIADMIRAAKMSLAEGQECGWSLIGLTAFPDVVPLDQSWTIPSTRRKVPRADGATADNDQWSIERVLSMEYASSVYLQPSSPHGIELGEGFHSTSCGGTHRLIGMSLAVQRYRKYLQSQGKPVTLTGGWQDAERLIALAIDRIRELQQEDGAFSAQFLRRPAITSDVAVRIRTTGHCLEFLALTLSPEELAQEWVTRAAVHLCELFEQTKELPLDCGAAYHALHALQVYREKRWGVVR